MIKLIKSFCKDIGRSEFIPLKVVNFFMYAALISLFPFLTLHARETGITEREYGMISGLLPVVTIFLPTLAGIIADKIGNFKWFLSGLYATTGVSGLLFILIPRRESLYLQQNDVNISLSAARGFMSLNEIIPCVTRSSDVDVLSVDCFCDKNKDESHVGLSYDVSNLTEGGKQMSFIIPYAWNTTDIMSVASRLTVDSCINQTCQGFIRREGCTIPNENAWDPQTVLIFYLIVRVINSFLLGGCFPLAESAVVAIVKEKKGDLGFQRLYCNLGVIIVTPISGYLIDYFTENGKSDFRPAFFLFFGLSLVNAFVILFIDLKFKSPAQNIFNDIKDLLKNSQVILLLFIGFSVGLCFGILDTFLFWLLDDLGADKSFMGLTVTVGCSFGIPVLFFSTTMLQRFGHVNTITLCSMLFVVRLIGYSYIPSPWWVMPFEAMESFTVSLFCLSLMSYGSKLSYASTEATMQTMITGAVHALGRGAGGFVGGFLVASFGLRRSFQVVACYIGCASTVYFILNKTIYKPDPHINKCLPQNSLKLVKQISPQETKIVPQVPSR